MHATHTVLEPPVQEDTLVASETRRNEADVTELPSITLALSAPGFPEQPLDTLILSQQSPLVLSVRRWWRGKYPRRGKIIDGFTGVETVEEVVVIRPLWTFRIL